MSTTDVICVPGERLGSTDECEAGRGTYVRKSFIYASRSALDLLKEGLQ
jgi:exosome complex RNA-binding protein Rrp4